MALDALYFDQSVSGLLVDGVESTPFTGAILKLENPRGVVVEVPYVVGDSSGQFTHVKEWFEDQTPPGNMILETPDGPIGLYGIRWRGHSMKAGVSLGKLAPRETLLGRCEAPLNEPLLLDEVHSRIDGLREWTGMNSIDFLPETDDHGLSVGLTVNVRALEGGTWQQGDATVQFRSDWRTSRLEDTVNTGLNIADGTVLVTRFPSPRPFSDHLAEQRKVANLLTLVSGAPINFRQHKVAAPSIVTLSVGGTLLAHPRVPLFSVDTVGDFSQPPPGKDDLKGFLSHFADVGAAGMTRWAGEHERWKRFIFPAVGVLGRKEAFVEDVIVSLSMSIEAAGQIIGARAGEEETHRRGKVTTATNVYRCLHALGVEWGDFATDNVALARAVAKAYNDIKHFDRGEFPEPDVSHLVSVIARYIVRLLALHIIDESGALLADLCKERALWRLHSLREGYGITFGKDGGTERTIGDK